VVTNLPCPPWVVHGSFADLVRMFASAQSRHPWQLIRQRHPRSIPLSRNEECRRTAALSFNPLRPLANAAGLLDRAQISGAQTVIRGRVFARGLEAILRDGRTDLVALTGIRCALRLAVGR
jgi:hypothetical protein